MSSNSFMIGCYQTNPKDCQLKCGAQSMQFLQVFIYFLFFIRIIFLSGSNVPLHLFTQMLEMQSLWMIQSTLSVHLPNTLRILFNYQRQSKPSFSTLFHSLFSIRSKKNLLPPILKKTTAHFKVEQKVILLAIEPMEFFFMQKCPSILIDPKIELLSPSLWNHK